MAQIDYLFDYLLNEGGSDLHLQQGQVPKIRLHGSLHPVPDCPVLEAGTMGAMMEEVCPPQRWERFLETGDLDFAYSMADRARFRINFQRHFYGLGFVSRIIPATVLPLEEIGAPEVLRTFAQFPSGLVLVTGPTGSGKSTTLAALIDFINSHYNKVILTIEDPIEFIHENKRSTIIQREIGADTESFEHGLRGALREDVDVVLVGEMRDLETVRLAVKAAEMGLLVFATLHTNSARKTVDRIVDVFPSEEQDATRDSLAVALRAVCAQLLLKRKDGKGRVPVHEVLIQTRAISNLIRENKTYQMRQTMMSGRDLGMQLLDDVLESHFKKGTITGEEAYMKAVNKEPFEQYAPIH